MPPTPEAPTKAPTKVTPITKKATAKKATAKKAAKKKAFSDTAKQAEMARKAIFKATGKRQVKPFFGPWPVVSSGSTTISQVIGGSISRDKKGLTCYGYPRTRVTEIYGPEHSGKTTLALEAIVACQKAGGRAYYIDYEHALHDGYAQAIGVDFHEDKLGYFRPDTLEEGMKMLYLGIRTHVDLIVCDSIAAMVPEKELKKSVGEEPKIGARAKALSELMPKIGIWLDKPEFIGPGGGTAIILINQIRAKITTGGGRGGANETTTGGYALKFFYSLRLKATRVSSEFIKRKDHVTGKEKSIPFGNHTVVKVIKNKIDGTTGHTADIFIRHGFGIDDYYSVIQGSVTQKIVKRAGAWYEYGEERFQGREPLRKYLMENDKVFEQLKAALQATYHVKDTGPVELKEEDELVSEMDEAFGGADEDEAYEADPDEISVEDIEL